MQVLRLLLHLAVRVPGNPMHPYLLHSYATSGATGAEILLLSAVAYGGGGHCAMATSQTLKIKKL